MDCVCGCNCSTALDLCTDGMHFEEGGDGAPPQPELGVPRRDCLMTMPVVLEPGEASWFLAGWPALPACLTQGRAVATVLGVVSQPLPFGYVESDGRHSPRGLIGGSGGRKPPFPIWFRQGHMKGGSYHGRRS
jgi:hypothetical protein